MIKKQARVVVLMCVIASLSAIGAQADEVVRETAVFAGGCFWCVEEAFEKVAGVTSAVSGYAQGTVANPTYQEVTRGDTGHAEVVEVRFDPSVVTYEELLDVFWRNIDPFDGGGQFCDRGGSYRSGIYYAGEDQRRAAIASLEEVERRFGRRIATEVEELDTFYLAEEYHQDFYKRNSLRYRYYKTACGRDRRLEEIWQGEAGGLL